MGKPQLQWIQALRGVAALMVLAFHLVPHWAHAEGFPQIEALTRWGFSGVDVFFALSGFVVYRAAKASVSHGEAAGFLQHRAIRIYAGYWPALLVYAAFSTLVNRPFPDLPGLLYSVTLFHPNTTDHWLVPAWSLTYELYFYAWTLALVLVGRRRPQVAIASAFVALVLWNIGWLLANPAAVANGEQPLRFMFPAFGIEFLAGALVSEWFDGAQRDGTAAIHRVWAAVVFAVGATFFATGVSAQLVNVEILRVATFGAAAASLLVAALCAEASGVRAPRWLCTVGDASYSLYLLHTILIDTFAAAWFKGLVPLGATPLVTAYVLATAVAIVILSVLWFHAVERPLLRAGMRLFAPDRKKLVEPPGTPA